MNERHAAAQRRYRERHPDRVRIHGLMRNARGAAATRLAREYRARFEELYVEECAKRGVPRYLPRLPLEEDARTRRVT